MIFNSGFDILDWLDKRYSHKIKWHRWFAWFPVRVNKSQYAWWQHVERIAYPHVDMNGMHFHWRYRKKGDYNEY